MLGLRYAKNDDVAFINKIQYQPEIRDFIGAFPIEDIANAITDPDRAYILALRDKKVPVGFAFLRQIERPERSIEIHQLAISERNRGYGRAFLKLIIAEAFGALNANRLWLDVFPENARARNVYQRCGFVEEGTLRDAYYWKGAFQSTIVMSLLAREFEDYKSTE